VVLGDRALLVQQASKALQDLKALWVHKDLRASKAIRERPEDLASQVLWVQVDLRAYRDHVVCVVY